jgi:hypothetical protein
MVPISFWFMLMMLMYWEEAYTVESRSIVLVLIVFPHLPFEICGPVKSPI